MDTHNAKKLIESLIQHLKRCSPAQWELIKQMSRVDNDPYKIWFPIVPVNRLEDFWNKRRTFVPSGRFGIKGPMIYLSSSPLNSYLEKNQKYRQNPERYDAEEFIEEALKDKSPILSTKFTKPLYLFDVQSSGSGFWLSRALNSVAYTGEIFKLVKAIHHPDEGIYPQTQELAQLIYKNGFNGVLYNPIRQPEKPPTREKNGKISQGATFVADLLASYKCPDNLSLLTDMNVIELDAKNLDPRIKTNNLNS